MNIYQRSANGYAALNGLENKNYPPISDTELFWNGRLYRHEKPETVHGWQWSTTFNKWSALVTFADGWHGYTYPK